MHIYGVSGCLCTSHDLFPSRTLCVDLNDPWPHEYSQILMKKGEAPRKYHPRVGRKNRTNHVEAVISCARNDTVTNTRKDPGGEVALIIWCALCLKHPCGTCSRFRKSFRGYMRGGVYMPVPWLSTLWQWTDTGKKKVGWWWSSFLARKACMHVFRVKECSWRCQVHRRKCNRTHTFSDTFSDSKQSVQHTSLV